MGKESSSTLREEKGETRRIDIRKVGRQYLTKCFGQHLFL